MYYAYKLKYYTHNLNIINIYIICNLLRNYIKMNLENLPDDILVNIIKNYLNLNDIIQLSYTCRRIFNLINNYHLWNIYTSSLPIIDFACANSDYK
jgi:hypothetical protein